MNDKTKTTVIACDVCGTEAEVEDDRSHDAVNRHNDTRHDGNRVAGVKVRTEIGDVILPHPKDVTEEEIREIAELPDYV